MKKCLDCKKEISRYAIRCQSCNNKGKNHPNYVDGRSLKKYYCKDCGNQLCASAYSAHSIRCKKCYIKFNRGVNHPDYKLENHKKHFCINCKINKICYDNWRKGKQLCSKCYIKTLKGKTHPNWKGKKYYCINCKKELKNYKAERCPSCSQKERNKIPQNTSGYKDGRSLKKCYCVDCKKQLSKSAYRGIKRCRTCITIKNIKKGIYGIKPNKPEKVLHKLLKDLFDNKYRYVGSGKFWITKFNPDFVNVKNKKIIEHFGDYWHNIPKEKERDILRLNAYTKAGYRTLIIWEHELKQPKQVIDKIIKFQEIK